MIDYTGQLVGEKYMVQQLLGKGGMGAVYQAEHRALKKLVAIKFLHGKYADNDDMVKRFYREAQATAEINHSNIVAVIDVGLSAPGEPFLVMELLQGESLSQLIKQSGPLDTATACGIAEPVLHALQAAHDVGIVHRDLKPDNIFLVRQPQGDPIVKLIDFGISKFLEQPGSSRMTQTGMVLGTPSYMSPEQAMGQVSSIDGRADIYALGVILFKMLTGELPIAAENNQEMIIKVATAQPRRIGQLRSDLPRRIEQIVMKAIAKNPMDRFSSCDEMLAALRKVAVFDQRTTSISQLGQTMVDLTFVGGDLGSADTTADTHPGNDRHRGTPRSSSTPGAWARTWRSYRAATPRTRIAVHLSVVAALALLGTMAFNIQPKNVPAVAHPTTAKPLPTRPLPAVPTVPPASPAPSEVSITVDGFPQGASIYYDDRSMETNPFSAPYGNAAKTLRVEADGFVPFATSLVPNTDQSITAALEEAPDTAPTVQDQTTRPRKKRKKRQPQPGGEKTLTTGRGNLLFAQEYE